MSLTPKDMTLPYDLMCKILLKLPLKDIYRYRCVSKSWLNIIQAPFLITIQVKKTLQFNNIINTSFIVIPGKDHISLHAMDFLSPENLTVAYVMNLDYPMSDSNKRIKLVGTCNGLICLQYTYIDHDEMYYYNPSLPVFFTLWNPFSGIYRIVTDMSDIHQDFRGGIYYSISYCYFGYDHVTDDYHVVRLSLSFPRLKQDRDYNYGFVLNIYSLKNDSWTKIVNQELQKWAIGVTGGVFNMGTFYLIGKQKENDTPPFYYKILAFDTAIKEFRLVDLPHEWEICTDRHWNLVLGEVDRVLSVRKHSWFGSREHLVWLINDEDDRMKKKDEELWSKKFEIVTSDWGVLEKLSPYSTACGASRDARKIIGIFSRDYVVWYDPQTKLTTKIQVEKSSSVSVCLVDREALVCLRTMVSPF